MPRRTKNGDLIPGWPWCTDAARRRDERRCISTRRRKYKHLPTPQGVIKWLHSGKHPDAVEQYARAREEQADHHADEIITIADDESIEPNSRKIMVDARKWVASKLKPKRYGDKLALGGSDDMPAIKHEVQERADAFTRDIATMAARANAGKDVKH